MANDLQMVAMLNPGTIERDAAKILRLNGDELRINLSGTLRFLLDGRAVFYLEGVPLLGVLAEFRQALTQVMRGRSEVSFNDFYGEFRVALTRQGADSLECANTFRGGSFTASLDAFVKSFEEGARIFLLDLERALPALKGQSGFVEMSNEVIGV
jgi:hypothetical protein